MPSWAEFGGPGGEVLMTCFSVLTMQTESLVRTEPRHYTFLQFPQL